MTSVAVLGASGFVGRALVGRLAASSWDVTAVVRRPTDVPPGVTVRVVPDGDWRAAVAGADVVVHLIARTHRLDDHGPQALHSYRATNVDLTRDVLAACEREGVRRLVYMSSVKAMGESRTRPYTEQDACRPVDAYGTTKLAAEELVRAARLENVVLRPPLVYGPGVAGNIARLVSAVRAGRPLPLGRAVARRSLVSVGNLAAAVETVLDAPVAGETFLVGSSRVDLQACKLEYSIVSPK